MFIDLTLGKRIASGILLMLMLMILVGAVGYFGLKHVVDVMEFSGKITGLDQVISYARSEADRYVAGVYSGDKDLVELSVKGVSEQLERALAMVGELRSDPAIRADDAEKLENSAKEINNFFQAFNQYRAMDGEKSRTEESINKALAGLLDHISKGAFQIQQMTLNLNITKSSIADYLRVPTEDNWFTVNTDMEKLDKVIKEWNGLVKGTTQLDEVRSNINQYFQDLKGDCDHYRSTDTAQRQLKKVMKDDGQKLEETCSEFIKISKDTVLRQKQTSIKLIFAVIALALLTGLIYAVISTKGTVRKLKSVIKGITDASNQVASSSSQVASTSQQLAEGASEQAAAIEETSSSLEEMASMARQNAENASQANQLMAEASRIARQANSSMDRLISSMADISNASEETQKIIKTVDEVAFQTNLLALNAAVEAARAGEAGAGFAVVADEVRNLALRAAEAARNTANLIERTVMKVYEGSNLVSRTGAEFREVASTVAKSGELVGEIATASQEQAQGIEQVNRAVADIDKVNQQNSASAEESASAAEALNAQSQQMRELVDGLVVLVGGHGDRSGNEESSFPRGKAHIHMTISTPASKEALKYSGNSRERGNGTELTVSPRGTREVRPWQGNRFEDDGMEDF